MDLHHRNTTMSIWHSEVTAASFLYSDSKWCFSIFNSVFTFSELYYFLLAPTLCFQRGFPCCPNVRINKLLHRLIEMVSWTLVSLFLHSIVLWERRIEKVKGLIALIWMTQFSLYKSRLERSVAFFILCWHGNKTSANKPFSWIASGPLIRLSLNH